MLVKLTIITPSGSVDAMYGNVPATVGGYVNFQVLDRIATRGTLLNHGDKILVEFVDQLEADERTSEDDRQRLAHMDGVLRDAIERR